MTKIQNPKHFLNLDIRIFNLFRISNFEFRILTQRGASLYLAVAIMAVLLSIALGISTIFLGQVKTIRGLGYSVVAFYAADAGIERILLERSAPIDIPETALSNGATYRVIVVPSGSSGCAAANYCIKSIGNYKGTNRAIEISY